MCVRCQWPSRAIPKAGNWPHRWISLPCSFSWAARGGLGRSHNNCPTQLDQKEYSRGQICYFMGVDHYLWARSWAGITMIYCEGVEVGIKCFFAGSLHRFQFFSMALNYHLTCTPGVKSWSYSSQWELCYWQQCGLVHPWNLKIPHPSIHLLERPHK